MYCNTLTHTHISELKVTEGRVIYSVGVSATSHISNFQLSVFTGEWLMKLASHLFLKLALWPSNGAGKDG